MKKNVICGGINTTTRTPIEIALSAEDGFTTAKKLYEWLELDPTHYSRWIQSNLIENPFAEEGTDYSPLMASIRHLLQQIDTLMDQAAGQARLLIQ